MTQGRIDVEIFFDCEGRRTCAVDFANGRVCPFYRTQRFGTHETCVFAPKNEQLHRRSEVGYLVTPDWCPIIQS